MASFASREVREAAALLQQALGTAARVIVPVNSASGYDLELLREEGPSTGLRLRRWDPGAEPDAGIMWVLRKPSRRILDALREREQNFVALNGSVRLVSNGLILDRTNLPRSRPPGRLPRHVDPFSDRNSLIARILLNDPGRRWGVREIAAAADLSPGTASLVVHALSGMGLVDFRRRGRASELWIDKPEPLIRRWMGAYSWDRNRAAAFHAPVGDPMRFVRRLPRLLGDMRWALTLHAGAAQVAPHATWDRVHVYVDVDTVSDLVGTGERQGWEAADDGRVVLMKPYYRTTVWHDLQTQDGLPVVSTLQLALDLWHYPLRGREQSEHLLKTVLKYDV